MLAFVMHFSFMGFLGRFSDLLLYFLVIGSSVCFWMGNVCKGVSLMLLFLILSLTLFLQQKNGIHDGDIFNIAIYADDTAICSNFNQILICGNSFNWILNLKLTFKTLDSDRKWLVDFEAGKSQVVSFDWTLVLLI